MSRLSRWLARSDRFWDRTLGRRTTPTPRRISVERLEDRVVPDGRPLPFPVIAVGPGAGAGLVRMFDAETGAEVLNVIPFQNSFLGGVRVAVGDLTGDLYPDLVTAAGPGGGPHVRTFDGKSGQEVAGPLGSFFAYDPAFVGGVQVAVGDVTGDGRPDLVTAADAGGGPHVRVFDGATGQLAYNFFAFEPTFLGGVRLAVGEFTGDGKSELVLAAGVGGAPRVRVLDTATLQPIAGPLGDFYAFDPSQRGGVWVATGDLTADVTGDMRADLVAGAGIGSAPEVKAFDGQSGAVVLSALAFDANYRGGVRVATAYVDDDPHADVVAGTGTGTAPRIRTLGGTTGQPVAGWAGEFDPNVGSAVGGVNVAAGNDPGMTTITAISLTASSKTVAVGVPFAVAGHIETSPALQSHSGGVDWDGVPPSPDETVGGSTSDWARTHTYATAPGNPVTINWVTTATGQMAYPANGNASVTLTVAGLPPDLGEDGECGAGSVMRPIEPWWVRYPLLWSAPSRGGVKNGGVATVRAADLGSAGFGGAWGTSRSWSNDRRYATGSALGSGWVSDQQPRLLKSGSVLVLIEDASSATYYDGQGTPDANGNYPTYLPRHGRLSAITFDAANTEFVIDEGSGGTVRFGGFASSLPGGQQGSLKSRTEPGGAVTEVYSRDSLGRPTEIRRSATVGGQTVTESYLSEYLPGSNPNAGLLWKETLRRQVGGGAWETVRKVEYSYYTAGESGGNVGDLERATVTDAAGSVLDQTYYRYYTADTFNGGTQIGYKGGLKYALGAAAYAQLKAASGGTDSGVETASDATVAQYADQALEFDSSKRVTKLTVSAAGCSMCSGGQGTYTYSYTTSSNTAGYNSWATKTVETLPDNNQVTYYANAYGQVMLEVYKDTTDNQEWRTFNRYDTGGRLVLTANPSAVTGHSESYADLVNYSGGNAQYLADSAGLVSAYTYYTSTSATESTAGGAAGFQQSASVRQGETGADVKQAEWTYFRRAAGGATVTPVATATRYRNTNGTGGQATSYAYTWQSGTTQVASVTTTLPTVTTSQNGPGTAATSTVVYDSYGRPIWAKDAGGFLTYAEYDTTTGAVTKSITDVDTDLTSDFANLPSGWSNPNGLHLKTTSEVDALGRATKVTDPAGHVTYTVFDDDSYEARTYRGWDGTTNLPTGPTEVVREDRANRYTEVLTMSATPAVTGGRPTGTEAVGSIQSLSRSYRNAAGQTTHTDAYFNLSGLTYTTSTSLGTQNTHFYRTQQDYDKQGRPNRSVSAAGTISRTVIDGQGRPVSEWVGTDDTPTSGFWSPTNLTGTDMVKVREYEYDGGGVGDGNLTKVTEVPGLSAANRVTQTWYDWRDRPVVVKAGVEGSEGTGVNRPLTFAEYDNLGQAVATELYDGDAVTVTTTGGVPDRPSSSLLRAKSTAEYDELGRAFRTKVFSVDPSSGSVSTDALTTNTWFDLRGYAIKTSSPGGLVQKVAYDGAGRATTVYTTDGGGDAGYSDADDVTGDAVLEQVETEYDANSNPIKRTVRQRFHDETDTGALGTPTTGVNARVSYSASYYDLADRMTALVDVGTNGGSSWTRPSTVPSRSDTVLVTSYIYNAAGRVWKVTDPKGLESRTEYDALGRTTTTVENYVDGTVSDADDKTTEYAYGPAGMTSLTAKLTGGGVQTTEWVYGVTQGGGGSAITTNDIVGKTKWPDPTSGAASASEQETVTVNGLGQTVTSTDRNGTVHTLTYDVLGRLTADAVTTLGSNVDGAVRRIETAYDGQGNAFLVTSYDAASGGNVVNQVQRDFNGLGQLTAEYQSHSGAVNTSTSPKVQYAYTLMTGGSNHSRLTSVTYPNGKVLTYNYSSGLNSIISRLSSLSDTSGTLESYDFLGLGAVVRRAHGQPGVDLTYIKQGAEGTGDAGDQYTGLDRFGRVVDQRWVKTSDGTHTDRFQYGYDRNSNRTYRDNRVNTAFGEVYIYDGLNQLASFDRGTLNGTKDGISGTPSRTQDWDYDALGNWDSVTTDSSTQTRGHNKQNEITSVSGATSPTFDANGNMTQDETGKQFVYDAWNRLKVVKDSGGVTLKTYGYDGLSRRVSVTAGGTTTDLYYSDRWQVLEERVGGTSKVHNVWSPVYVDAVVLRDRDADGSGGNGLEERLWVQQDANWNVTAIVNGSGSVVERYAYDPFGKQTVLNATWTTLANSGVDWLHGFQGIRYDTVAALYVSRYRPGYSPTLGRWPTPDPLGIEPDENIYRFVGNRPVNFTDPDGLQAKPDWPHWMPNSSEGSVPVLMPDGSVRFVRPNPGMCRDVIDLYKKNGLMHGGSDHRGPLQPLRPFDCDKAIPNPAIDEAFLRRLFLIRYPNAERECTAKCLAGAFADAKTYAGIAVIGFGMPLIPKRFTPSGTSPGTSVWSLVFRCVFGDTKLPFGVPTVNPFRPNPIAWTRSLGSALGRGAPVVGWIILAAEARDVMNCTFECWEAKYQEFKLQYIGNMKGRRPDVLAKPNDPF